MNGGGNDARRRVEGGGIGAALASVAALLLDKWMHSEIVPMDVHLRLFEEMKRALELCQGG